MIHISANRAHRHRQRNNSGSDPEVVDIRPLPNSTWPRHGHAQIELKHMRRMNTNLIPDAYYVTFAAWASLGVCFRHGLRLGDGVALSLPI